MVVFVYAGGNYRWPNLVGKPWQYAKKIIEGELPRVGVVVLRKGAVRIFDFCCNRVFVYIDDSGIVAKVPVIG
ncbi:protease inhibitor HPI-like [Cucumis melo var. makuwa]|uniref:Protease inhibitor HPI-like n=1 Tax=Cucumis melo var. makuwa TaxID=1194695 RepID=A0A5D3C8A6_CUCMM|nr:protease inhibitor HPI-like [Cucumis melo var. makuwa]